MMSDRSQPKRWWVFIPVWAACACSNGTAGRRAVDPHVAGAERTALDARVDVGGLALHIHCEGEGRPAVVFDSGLGLDGSGWFDAEVPVGRATAAFTRACAYDRAGRGQSDPPASRPHSNRQMSKELFALLQNAGERPPFVLVGHSMGGTNVQLFLADHPESVAGMVLLDASPEPPPIADIPALMVAEFERGISTLEGLDLRTLLAGFEELRASSRSLGNKPLVILAAGKSPAGPDVAGAEEAQRSREQAQRPLGALSTNSAFVIVPDSGHHIPNDAPKVVIRAVEVVVNAVRTGERLDAGTLL